MSRPEVYRERRSRLSTAVAGKPILLRGHDEVPRNFAGNPYPFRQDSNLLYFTGVQQPGAAAVIGAGGHTTLFLPSPHPDDPLWHGVSPSFGEVAAAAGVDEVRARDTLSALPRLEAPTGDPSRMSGDASDELIAAIVAIRLRKDLDEVAAIRRAAGVTRLAHVAAMQATRPGVLDSEVGALVDGIFALHGMVPAYGSIVTARGEVLHGKASGAPLVAGELLLVDAGAEEPGGYASDVTRTWPVSGSFTPRQRDVYEAVLEAQLASIALVRAGVEYRDVHLASARVLARALSDFGLLRGDVDGLVEQGAHSVFYPHGVGHLLGLDVHDMEGLGDIGYAPGRARSTQFGLSFLRLDRRLERGTVVTIEPGLYFVPAILDDPRLHDRLGDAVDWDAARKWLPFGGVRIEDDVLVTDDAPEVLSADIPKGAAEVEALVGQGPSPRERLLPHM